MASVTLQLEGVAGYWQRAESAGQSVSGRESRVAGGQLFYVVIYVPSPDETT
ncbi:MAG: hypothetical protein ACOC90_00540 [Bacteroidota bacterium]